MNVFFICLNYLLISIVGGKEALLQTSKFLSQIQGSNSYQPRANSDFPRVPDLGDNRLAAWHPPRARIGPIQPQSMHRAQHRVNSPTHLQKTLTTEEPGDGKLIIPWERTQAKEKVQGMSLP